MEKLIEIINKPHETIKIDNNFVEIKTNVELKKGYPLKLFIKRIDNNFYLTDNKNTLRFMNTIYQLTAPDVKQCINDIIHHYQLKIEKGEILTPVTENNLAKRYNEFLICCCTLANMFIFFDDPNN